MTAFLRRLLARSPLARVHNYTFPTTFAAWVTCFGIVVAYVPADGSEIVTEW